MKEPILEANESNDDEVLMRDLIDHQPDALRQLYDRYYTVLRSIVLRVVHDQADADDVLQDVFLQLWMRAENYSPEKGKPLGWLITLARRRAIDRLRQRLAYRRATERFEVQYTQAHHELNGVRVSERTAYGGDIRAYLENLIRRLPPAQKEVLERAFFDGMSQREIAAAMQLPLGTVKTRIELGLRKLSNVMIAARQKIV